MNILLIRKLDRIEDKLDQLNGIEERLRTLEKMLESDTWGDEVRDLTGRFFDLKRDVKRLKGRVDRTSRPIGTATETTGTANTVEVKLGQERDQGQVGTRQQWAFEGVVSALSELGHAPSVFMTPKVDLWNDLGFDDLNLIELVMDLEEKFGITIPDATAYGWMTVGDVVETVKKLSDGANGSTTGD